MSRSECDKNVTHAKPAHRGERRWKGGGERGGGRAKGMRKNCMLIWYRLTFSLRLVKVEFERVETSSFLPSLPLLILLLLLLLFVVLVVVVVAYLLLLLVAY